MKRLVVIAVWLWAGAAWGQVSPGYDAQTPTLTSRTTLVLVPALVTTKGGEPVFTLQAKDFIVTDDGVEQKVTLSKILVAKRWHW
jgi:hypothetical protein